jgi:hypothetical protein
VVAAPVENPSRGREIRFVKPEDASGALQKCRVAVLSEVMIARPLFQLFPIQTAQDLGRPNHLLSLIWRRAGAREGMLAGWLGQRQGLLYGDGGTAPPVDAHYHKILCNFFG